LKHNKPTTENKTANSAIQTGLKKAGYDPGPVDGRFGPRTRAATEAWIANEGRSAGTAMVAIANSNGAMIYQGAGRAPANEIILHCAATRPDWRAGETLAQKVHEIRRWHVVDRGWKDIGYHYVIDRDGEIAQGRAETTIGAHTAGHNRGTIGICLLGGFGSSETDQFSDHFTPAQDQAVRDLISDIQSRTLIKKISGHNEYAAKACPGFNVTRWLAR